MVDPHVLDTSAIFCLMEKEEGYEQVRDVLRAGGAHASFLSIMEFLYINFRKHGEDQVKQAYVGLKALPIEIVESDEELCLLAARIKAGHRLSLADAWVAATAEHLGAVLVHKDPEFDALEDRVRMLRLPRK